MLLEGLIHGGAYFQNFMVILQKKFKKCEDFLTLHMYYFYHKNILKARVICCLTHNLQLTVIPGGHFRNFWVGMCRWDPGTLDLYQS